ncbi:MAG: hypothetical protein HUJ59_00565 [Bacilli bacterium]|nr:hypothetical protein [Bacilli bacterium]
MEKVVKKTRDSLKHILVRQMKMFDWTLEQEKRVNKLDTELTFTRDDEVSYIDELRHLEKDYFKNQLLPNWLVVLMGSLAFIFLTLFLVFGLLDNTLMTFNLALIIFLIPAVLCSIVLGVLCIYNTKQAINIAENEKKRDTNFIEKVKNLKNGN